MTSRKLAQKIQASFELPQWMSKEYMTLKIIIWPHWHPIVSTENDFLSLPYLRFPCWDLNGKNNRKKTVAYAQALQYWAEESQSAYAWSTMPFGGICPGTMKDDGTVHFMFPDDVIPGNVALPEGFFGSQASISTDTPPTPSDIPPEEVAAHLLAGPLRNLCCPQVPHEKWVKMETPPSQFLGWEKVLHPSQPVATVGQAPPACGDMKHEGTTTGVLK